MITESERHYSYADVISWDDFERYNPETNCHEMFYKRYELYGGRLVELETPPLIHQSVAGALIGQMFFDRERKCSILPGPFDVCLFAKKDDEPQNIDTVIQPDISMICDESKLENGRYCVGAPDLIIEILDQFTKQRDRKDKFFLYQKAGVKEYWIVDPLMQIVSVHALINGQYYSPVVYTAKAAVPVGIFEDCTIDLSLVFPQDVNGEKMF